MAVAVLNRRGSTSPENLRLPKSRSSQSRSPLLVGVLLVAGCALTFLVGVLHLDHRPSVIVVRHAVAAGTIVQASDLSVARVSTNAALHPILSTAMTSVVGRPAAVSLVPGTLLTDGQLGPATDLTPTQALVGVAVKSGQFPPNLAVGSHVEIIDTGESGPGALGGTGSVIADGAIVTSVNLPSATDQSSAATVELKVSSEAAPNVTSASAAGRIGLVQEPAAP